MIKNLYIFLTLFLVGCSGNLHFYAKNNFPSIQQNKVQTRQLSQEVTPKKLLMSENTSTLTEKSKCLEEQLQKEKISINDKIKIQINYFQTLDEVIRYKQDLYSFLLIEYQTIKPTLLKECRIPTSFQVSINIEDSDIHFFDQIFEEKIQILRSEKVKCFNDQIEIGKSLINVEIKNYIESLWTLDEVNNYQQSLFQEYLQKLRLVILQNCQSDEVDIDDSNVDIHIFDQTFEAKINCLKNSKCVEEHEKKVAEDIFQNHLNKFREICEIPNQIKALYQAINFERSNPSGYVNKTLLYEYGRDIQTLREILKEKRSEFKAITNRDFPIQRCESLLKEVSNITHEVN